MDIVEVTWKTIFYFIEIYVDDLSILGGNFYENGH